MKCRKAQKLISKHVDSQLEELLARELRAHIAQCAECREFEARLGATLDLLDKWEPVEPVLSFEALEARLEQRAENARGVTRQPLFGVPGWAAAGLAALSILAGTMAAYNPMQEPAAGELPTETQVASALNLRSFEGVIEDYLVSEIDTGTDSPVQGGESL